MTVDYYKNQREEFEDLIAQHIDVKRRGFKKTHESFIIVYDSEWCRVRFFYGFMTMWGAVEESSIWYGRLDVPDVEVKKVVNGLECRCWHALYYYVLDYLGGSSPQEAMAYKGQCSELLGDFYKKEEGKEIYNDKRTADTIKTLRLHNMIWEHYGQRLFDLFDLRRPDLWEDYKQYLREVQRLKDEDSIKNGKTPLSEIIGPFDRIC